MSKIFKIPGIDTHVVSSQITSIYYDRENNQAIVNLVDGHNFILPVNNEAAFNNVLTILQRALDNL